MNDYASQISRAADIAVARFQARSAGKLDYSCQSLAFIEELLADAADFVPDMSEQQVDSLVQLIGSYIFEVAKREFGGKFYWYEQQGQPVLVVGEPDFRIALLVGSKVRGRLSGDEADNIPFFYDGFASRVRSAQPGADVLYV